MQPSRLCSAMQTIKKVSALDGIVTQLQLCKYFTSRYLSRTRTQDKFLLLFIGRCGQCPSRRVNIARQQIKVEKWRKMPTWQTSSSNLDHNCWASLRVHFVDFSIWLSLAQRSHCPISLCVCVMYTCIGCTPTMGGRKVWIVSSIYVLFSTSKLGYVNLFQSVSFKFQTCASSYHYYISYKERKVKMYQTGYVDYVRKVI